MAVRIELLENNEDGAKVVVNAVDLESNEQVPVKNWFEKSKSKWHFVLGTNSANRKYVAHNEFFTKAVDNVYVVEDKTTGPRVLGTANPYKYLVPFMTDEDKAVFDEIMAKAKAAFEADKKKPMSELEKLMAQRERLNKKIAQAEAVQNIDAE